MIDSNNIWRIIDIDGLKYRNERRQSIDENSTTCMASRHDIQYVPSKNQIDNKISSNGCLNLFKNALISIKDNGLQMLYINDRLRIITKVYQDMIETYLVHGSNNKYYKKYLKYKAKYIKLKNML